MARDERFWPRGASLAAALLAALSLVGCTGSWKWNQKLTVEVITPYGVKSGSAVSSVSWSKSSDPFSGHYAASYRGEATVVEVAPGKYLFALIGEPAKFLAGSVFGGSPPYGNIPAIRETREVSPKAYPLLVTFTDISNPKTVKKVDPANLVASFGPGARLKSITLEITDEARTEGRVEALLPWLGPHPEPKLGPATGGTTNIPFYRTVSQGDFIRR